MSRLNQGNNHRQGDALPANSHGYHNQRRQRYSSGGVVAEGERNIRPAKPMGLGSSSGKQSNRNQPRAQSSRGHPQPSVNPTFDYPFLQDDKSVFYINGSRVMFILRGVSGSGKTTLALAIQAKYNKVTICSADDFFVSDGVYQFDGFRLPDAHNWCKQRAQRACQNKKHNIVIVDNTNNQLWEFEPYLDVAKANNYVVIIAEPKTSWRRDVAQLEKKSVHNIPASALKKKLNTYEDFCPEYFGWFVNEADTQMLHSIAQAYLDEFSRNSEFKQDFSSWATNFRDLKSYFFGNSFDETCQLFHCTAHYVGDECDTDEYSRRKVVLNSLGKVYTLRVVGFVITPRTFGVRLQLDDEALKLWNQKDNEGGPGGCDDLARNMSRLQLQDKTSKPRNGKKCGNQCPSTIPTLHWTGRVRYEKRFNPTFGRGSRAHITLGCASNASAVQTGFDLVNVINCEKRANDTPPKLLFHVHEGVAGTYGNGQWVVYLNKQIEVKALFAGSY